MPIEKPVAADWQRDDYVPAAVRNPKRGVLRMGGLALRRYLIAMRRAYFVRVWKMDIDPSAWFSLKVHFDRTHPRGIHIGPESYVAFGAVLLTHDMTRGIYADTRVGARCFIGAHSILLPGVTIGDGSIVAAGSVVTRDVAPGSIAAGNPARTVRTGIKTYRFGCLWNWESTKYGGSIPDP
ncbi:MAG TPA: acyltransferase [Xanthobacteraceae bacterium]|nr:acyltransferase [Xanthobacteraceae bacterium]